MAIFFLPLFLSLVPSFCILQVSFLKMTSSPYLKGMYRWHMECSRNTFAVCVADHCITGRLVDSRQGVWQLRLSQQIKAGSVFLSVKGCKHLIRFVPADHSSCFSFWMTNTVVLSLLLSHLCLNSQFSGLGFYWLFYILKNGFHSLLQTIAPTYISALLSIRFAHTEKHQSYMRVPTDSLYLRVKAAETFGSASQLSPNLPHHFTCQLRLASTPRQRNLELLDLVFLQNLS